MNVIEKMRVHKVISEHPFPWGRRYMKAGRRGGWGRDDLDRIVREGLLEEVTSEPRPE